MADNQQSLLNSLHNRVAYIDSTLRQAMTLVSDVETSLDADRKADGGLAAELFNLDRALTQLEHCMRKLTPADSDHTSTTDSNAADQISGEKELLLQALDAQEARIRELERQLRDSRHDNDGRIAKTGNPGDGQDVTQVITNKSLEENPYANRMIVTINESGNLKLPLNSSITTIGREPGNDVQIRSRFVSRYHARIVSDDDGAVIEDLDSRNGVSVNAEKVGRRQLRSGDFIKIGRIQLQYIDIMEETFGGGAA